MEGDTVIHPAARYGEMYYYYDETGSLAVAPSPSKIPENVEMFAKLSTAISFVQKLGCVGMSQHIVADEFHQLCLDILRQAVETQGEVFPIVLRGVRPSRYSDADHKIMFGTTQRKVAEFYGDVREYHNIKGLKTFSLQKSVNYDENMDETEMDEEIIFFPV